MPAVKKRRSPAMRTALFVAGIVVVIVSPVIGAIPGPGGVFVFAAGLALMLQNSTWAKKRFVGIAKRWPRIGHYADIGLRRRSAARRRALRLTKRDALLMRTRYEVARGAALLPL